MNSNVKKRILMMPMRRFISFIRSKLQHLIWVLRPESSYPNALKKWYKRKTGEDLDLDDPKNFDQKIQWLKLYDSTTKKGRLADKYNVREWIEEQIGSDYLVPLLGVWDDPNEIDFDELPDRFVLKATHGSGWNIVVTDKDQLDKKKTIDQLKHWLNSNFDEVAFEFHYRYCEPRIIAEKYLEETTGAGAQLHSIVDYKFYTFGGTRSIILVCAGRDEKYATKEAFYDENWIKLDIAEGDKDNSFEIERPIMFDEMLALTKKLASGFSYVRVDWYVINGKLYFSEMTFTPTAGTMVFRPPEWNEIFGSWIEPPDRNDDHL